MCWTCPEAFPGGWKNSDVLFEGLLEFFLVSACLRLVLAVTNLLDDHLLVQFRLTFLNLHLREVGNWNKLSA